MIDRETQPGEITLNMDNQLQDSEAAEKNNTINWLGDVGEISSKIEKASQEKDIVALTEQWTKEFSMLREEFTRDNGVINGEKVLNIAKFLKETNEMDEEGKEIINNIFSKIFPVNSRLSGKMVDAMAVYADSIGMSGKEVSETYQPFFENSRYISHVGRGDVNNWLKGELKSLTKGENAWLDQVKDK